MEVTPLKRKSIPLQFKVKDGTSQQHCSAFPKLFPGYTNKMADTEVIETKEARVVERTPAVAGVNGPIGTATNATINGESPADENDVGTTEVTIRSVSNDDASSSVYAEEIVDIIAIGSAVSPIKPPDIRTNQDGGEYETMVNKTNERKQSKRQTSKREECSGSSAASPHAKLLNNRDTSDRVRQFQDTRS